MMRVFLSIMKLAFLGIIIIVLPIYLYLSYPDFFRQFSTIEGANAFLIRYHAASILAYLGLQVLQIVISVIPGQFIQLAGGFAFGFWFGYILSVVGIALGSSAAFGLARILGRDGIHLLFGEERVSRFVKQLNSKKAFAILFVIFLVPGLPKDLVTYVAGISHFKFKSFITLSLIARTPALMGSIMMGSMLNSSSYVGLAILIFATVIFCIVLYFNRHKLTSYIDKLYIKFTE